MRLFATALFCWLIVNVTGCGDTNLASVRGTVTVDGVPLPDATVKFVPNDGRSGSSYGRTDARGRYRMEFTRDLGGVRIGESTVRISTEDVLDVDGQERAVPERVAPRYNRQSELVRRVEPGSNRFDFVLSSNDPSSSAVGNDD